MNHPTANERLRHVEEANQAIVDFFRDELFDVYALGRDPIENEQNEELQKLLEAIKLDANKAQEEEADDEEEVEFEEEDNNTPSDSINACALVGIACSFLVVMYV